MVSGVAALMLAAKPTLTPGQLIARLQSSALPFPTSSSDTSHDANASCLDEHRTPTAISPSRPRRPNASAPRRPAGPACSTRTPRSRGRGGIFVQITPSSTTGLPGQHITLDGSGSTAATGYHASSATSGPRSRRPATSCSMPTRHRHTGGAVVPSIQVVADHHRQCRPYCFWHATISRPWAPRAAPAPSSRPGSGPWPPSRCGGCCGGAGPPMPAAEPPVRFELNPRPDCRYARRPEYRRGGASVRARRRYAAFPGFEEKLLTVICPAMPWRPGAVARVIVVADWSRP